MGRDSSQHSGRLIPAVTSHSAGGAAETDSVRKESKYSALPSDCLYNLGLLNGSGLDFLNDVSGRLSASS